MIRIYQPYRSPTLWQRFCATTHWPFAPFQTAFLFLIGPPAMWGAERGFFWLVMVVGRTLMWAVQ